MIHYYFCPVLPPEDVRGKREYRAYLHDVLRLKTDWVRAQMYCNGNPDGTPSRPRCLVMVDASPLVHAELLTDPNVKRLTPKDDLKQTVGTDVAAIAQTLAQEGVIAVARANQTLEDLVQAVAEEFIPGCNTKREREIAVNDNSL